MSVKRLLGSYYTPANIADFVVSLVLSKSASKTCLSILEPSAGDGIFVDRLLNRKNLCDQTLDITAIEVMQEEAEKVRQLSNSSEDILKVECCDFLEYQSQHSEVLFDVVIGNPPYIKRSLLTKKQISLCSDIHTSFQSFAKNTVKNIWSAFLLRSITMLSPSGVLAYVLPAELLQVNYAKELREILINNFQRIEVYTFNDLLFKECKGQDTIILIGEKISDYPGLFFCNIPNQDSLLNNLNKFDLTCQKRSSHKWTSHMLSNEELHLIGRIAASVPKVGDICSSNTGIVTAANEFFILRGSQVSEFSLSKYAKPIIQNATLSGMDVFFDNESLARLQSSESPSKLIDFNGHDVEHDPFAMSYIKAGEKRKFNERFKMKSRVRWFDVPSIRTAAPGLFFKRCSDYPKIMCNEAEILSTDSAYLIYPANGFLMNGIVFSFYNSLSLIFAELTGRYYGGGVLELTPKEFKSLPLPYVELDDLFFESYKSEFSSKKNIKDILIKYDMYILSKYCPDLTGNDYEALRNIHSKLCQRRLRL